MQASAFRSDLFAGKRAFVTGGSQGLGLAVAGSLARHGAHVTIGSRKQDHLEGARTSLRAEGLTLETVALDVRDRPGVEAVAEGLESSGGIDILVNNAAGNFPVPFVDMSENAWDAVVNIVLQGTANVCRSFGRRWLKAPARPRSVVNVLAGYAWTGAPLVSHSGAAKAGVMNLTRSLAVEWASKGIRVNAVSPGAMEDTGGTRLLVDQLGLRDRIVARIPAGRMATAGEVADAILFLASPAASYVTGAVLVVDGGSDANSWTLDLGMAAPPS